MATTALPEPVPRYVRFFAREEDWCEHCGYRVGWLPPRQSGAYPSEEDGIELPQRLTVDSALDDGAVTGGSPDGAKDGQWSAGGNSAGSGNDDDRDRCPDIAGDEKGEYSRAKREIDQVSGKAFLS